MAGLKHTEKNQLICHKKVPDTVIARLSIYYRGLSESRQNRFVSSEELAGLTGFEAAQIRRDLSYFGQFGTPGRGYDAKVLKQKILQILGIDRKRRIALIGVGNLGAALLGYKGFKEQGLEIVAAFDNDRRKIGRVYQEIEVEDIRNLAEVVRKKGIEMAIVTVPASAAVNAINNVMDSGIRAILNFAPLRVRVPETVTLLNIDMAIELERLSYFAMRNSRMVNK